jgi:hypothetical protein
MQANDRTSAPFGAGSNLHGAMTILKRAESKLIEGDNH